MLERSLFLLPPILIALTEEPEEEYDNFFNGEID
jgi:hypothetical protein